MTDYISKLTSPFENKVKPFSIESGYFIFTLMPSLRCNLNCPHCYLTLDQRRNSPIMSLSDLEIASQKVNLYYKSKNIAEKVIIFYWYGGEPTQMGINYFTEATNILNRNFPKEEGYIVKHTVLTSLLTVENDIWFPFFKEKCDNHFQTSFDGLMRGKGYMRAWEKKIKEAKEANLEIGTISVVNHELLKDGPVETLEYLSSLGIKEASFLPFMWNEQNDGAKYDKFAPSMNAWSDFMITLSQHYFDKKNKGEFVPEIGQLSFILHQQQQVKYANIAGQTLFLLPDGDFVLPDYKNGYQEFMQPFGNILNQSFEEVLKSPERKKYLRRQALRNGNKDCNTCPHTDKCVMEFWKDNREGDDCFGGRRYVEWLINHPEAKKIDSKKIISY